MAAESKAALLTFTSRALMRDVAEVLDDVERTKVQFICSKGCSRL